MGISGLLPALQPITKNIHVKDYAGKRVAIDGYSWLHKGAYSCSEEICQGKPTNKYINYCLNHIRMLKSYKIIPIVIFDGGPLPNKKGKEQERYQSREEYKNKAKAYLLEGNRTLANSCYQKAVDITPKMAYNLIKELQRMKIEYLVAPFEADAQLAYLAITGQVDAVLTEDSDLIAYGAPNIIFKMDKQGYAQEIKLEDIGSCNKGGFDFVDFNLTMLRHMCILSGCDYLPSLQGMGLKTAYKLIKQHRDIEQVFKHIRREKRIQITPDYEMLFHRADFTFKHQRVYDPCTKKQVTVLPLNKDYHEKDIFFIGQVLDDKIVENISLGIIDPNSFELFDPSIKPQQQPTISFIVQPKKDQYNESFNSNNIQSFNSIDKSKSVDHFKNNRITQYFSPPNNNHQQQQEEEVDFDFDIGDDDLIFQDEYINESNQQKQQQQHLDEYVLDSDCEEILSDDENVVVKQQQPQTIIKNNITTTKIISSTSRFFTNSPVKNIDEVLNSDLSDDDSDQDDDIALNSDNEMVEDSDTSFEVKKLHKNNNNNVGSTLLTKERISLNFFDQFQFNGRKKESLIYSSTKNQQPLPTLSLSLSTSNNNVFVSQKSSLNNSNNSINNNNINSRSTSTLNFVTTNSNNNLKKRNILEDDFSEFIYKKAKHVNSQPSTPTSSQNQMDNQQQQQQDTSTPPSLRKSYTYPSVNSDENANNETSSLLNSIFEKTNSNLTSSSSSSSLSPSISSLTSIPSFKFLNQNQNQYQIQNESSESTTTFEITKEQQLEEITTPVKSLNLYNGNNSSSSSGIYGNSSADIISKYFSPSKKLNTPTQVSKSQFDSLNNSNIDNSNGTINFKSRLLSRAKQAMESASQQQQ